MAIVDNALAGKVALVTGASRGIGRAIAVALGQRQAKVVVAYQSREDAARSVAAQVTAAGPVVLLALVQTSAVSCCCCCCCCCCC